VVGGRGQVYDKAEDPDTHEPSGPIKGSLYLRDWQSGTGRFKSLIHSAVFRAPCTVALWRSLSRRSRLVLRVGRTDVSTTTSIDAAGFTTVSLYKPDRHTVIFLPWKTWFPQIVHFPGPLRLDTVSLHFGLATPPGRLPN
jgi:hypothetical protein